MKKKLILINDTALNDSFTKSFVKEGYDVFPILEKPIVYKRNWRTKLMNIFYRVVLKDNSFFKKLFHKNLEKEVYNRIKNIETPIDYAIVFSAHYYSERIIKLLRKKSKKLISYQVDGWELCHDIVKYRDYFDRVFFFDNDDLPKYGDKALPLTNCYFTEENPKDTSSSIDLFYLGGWNNTRLSYLKNIYNRLQGKYILKALMHIPEYKEEENILTDNKGGGIYLKNGSFQYNKNIDFVKKSKCIIDIKFDYHNGLSFRFFEALYYKKKLITNNATVKNYDFYHANNIFIMDFENLDGIEEFLEKPYAEIDLKIVDKYGFPNWSRYLLDTPPYQEITNGKN